MKQFTGILILVLLSLGFYNEAAAQVNPIPKDSVSKKKGSGGIVNDSTLKATNPVTPPADTLPVVRKKNRFKRGEFNFIINRAFAGASNMSDSVPISSINSGSLFIGGGYNFNINEKFALTVQPGLNFFKIRYKNNSNSEFPVYADTTASISYKRQMITYAEVPVGVVYTFKRDEKKSRVTYAELGVFGGVEVAERFRVKYRTPDNYSLLGTHTEIKKIRNMGYMNPARYGVYARVGQGFLSFYTAFRFSNVFFNNRREIDPDTGIKQLYPNPKLFGLELGFGVVL
ncbi:MAG: hypothetical protein K1X92_12170 [Bacteroidia bacterium]|nr:hypothetical protein [Bacteroidia bacterium]